MADVKISQLTGASTPLTGAEEVPVVQSGSTLKATTQDIADLGIVVAGAGTLSTLRTGANNTASGNQSTAFGQCNTASGLNSFVGGGIKNFDQAHYGFVGGGICNNVCNTTNACLALGAVVVGGVGNNTTGGTWDLPTCSFSVAPTICNAGQYSFVGGGLQNIASGNNSVAIGGLQNTSSGCLSLVGGGASNIASGVESIVVGGDRNTAQSINSFIGGGICNNVCNSTPLNAIGSVVVGGIGNNTTGGTWNVGTCSFSVAPTICSTGRYSFVGGGLQNSSSNTYTFTGGGCGNVASSTYSTIVGGRTNTNNAVLGFLGGGWNNSLTGAYGLIGSGRCNTTSAVYSVTDGGFGNITSGACSFTGSGYYNTNSGGFGVLVGGCRNTLNSLRSGILGGICNNTCGFADAMILGSCLNATQACTTFTNCVSANNLTTGCAVCVGTNKVLNNYTPAYFTKLGFNNISDYVISGGAGTQNLGTTTLGMSLAFGLESKLYVVSGGNYVFNLRLITIEQFGGVALDIGINYIYASAGGTVTTSDIGVATYTAQGGGSNNGIQSRSLTITIPQTYLANPVNYFRFEVIASRTPVGSTSIVGSELFFNY